MTISKVFILLIASLLIGNTNIMGQETGCSLHEFLTCHPRAKCIDLADGSFKCECPANAIGDGLKGENHTGCVIEGEHVPCLDNSTCHKTLGFCSSSKMCECMVGFTGDGVSNCKDIDECNSDSTRCDRNARCVNTLGSYGCICKTGFKGDGFVCNSTCIDDRNCKENAICNMELQQCQCKEGYEGPTDNCTDINECKLSGYCDDSAICTNLPGTYNCTCKPGLYGDGHFCSRTPKTCQIVIDKNPSARSGSYEIDPDGAGPLKPIKVYCIMRGKLGITVFETTFRMWIKFGTQQVKYNADIASIRSVGKNSGFCYQHMSYKSQRSPLFDGGTYWTDGTGGKQFNWGGSNETGMCLCGIIGYCIHPTKSCNNDGSTGWKTDSGKIVTKSLLPIRAITLQRKQKPALITFGNVMCSSKPFDFPVDCHEAKFKYNVRQNESVFIDVDGPEGPQHPIPVFCQMTEEFHVGITIISHKQIVSSRASLGVTKIEYMSPMEDIRSLIKNSQFCMQELKYECKNSGLMAGNSSSWFDGKGVAQDYWAGALGESGKCGCGILKTCDRPDVFCNCDIKDGKTREDFGFIIDKSKLPVTALAFHDLPAGSWGRYTLGPLKCSQFQFGIKETCHAYRIRDYKSSYTYLIDLDGHIGGPPFPVYCQMIQDPVYGITVVHHHHNITVNAKLTYIRTTTAALKKLINYSTYCKQSFTYKCQKAPLHTGANLPFSGPGGISLASVKCECEKNKNCATNMKCNCDTNDNTERVDKGTITWKRLLPVSQISLPQTEGTSKADLLIGPLMCYELRKNCDGIIGRRRLYDHYPLKSDFYTIDPDGAGKIEPFKVECKARLTFIDTEVISETEGQTNCYNVTYNFGVKPEQVTALVKNSLFCTQKLIYHCHQNPATDHVYFATCDGVKQTGWAGSDGKDMCACGVTGTCQGKAGSKCNCDAEPKQWLNDYSYIQNKKRLPVCRVCATLKKAIPGETHPLIGVQVLGLFCAQKPLWKSKTCQDHRNSKVLQSGNYFLYAQNTQKQVPVYCQMINTPPTGILLIFPKESFYTVNVTGIDVMIDYYVLDMVYIETLILNSVYCTQELTLTCNKAKLELKETYGWYSRDGVVQKFWSGNEGGNGCKGGKCNCDGILNDTRIDGDILLNKKLLPVSRIKLGPSEGTRILNIGPLKCYSVYRDCDEIKKMRMMNNPLRNNIYSIDPDGAGGENLFAAKCDFKTESDIGITEVEHSAFVPSNVGTPTTEIVNLTYSYATPEQIHGLVKYGKYCHQDVAFTCARTPLINNGQNMYGYLVSQANDKMKSFGTGPWNDTIGCACKVTNTCPNDKSCHCDELLPTPFKERGVITAKEFLPLRGANFQPLPSGGTARLYVSSIRCGPRPIDLPTSCIDAQRKNIPPGETFIQPSKSVDPFFVYCDANMVPGTVVTIIGNIQEETTDFNNDITITYHNVTFVQIEALINIMGNCYQPVRFDCFKTMFVGTAGAYWFGKQNKMNQYFGSSDNIHKMCTCGMDRLCGGRGGKTQMMQRACNCDNADKVWRRDGGILSQKSDLPLRRLKVPVIPSAKMALKVGKLYCADRPFDIDECALGFHDCHPNATCVNENPGFKCYCKTGFRGHGVIGAFANGRECPDDNECGLRMCPWSAHCKNLPGTFKCTCRNGFTQTGPLTCEDIDECKTGTHNCDPNAQCVNTEGGFFCRCKRNFRGNGTLGFCERIGICQCFGDPHCLSFDDKWLHFQGKCKYMMVSDKCSANAIPTFEVQTLFWDEHGPNKGFTWVKEVTVIIGNTEIGLLQNKILKVNGVFKNVPHKINEDIMIQPTPKFLELITSFGLKVSWDGVALVEVKIPRSYINKTCGLCGRFNDDPTDDWTIGPMCDVNGPLTENMETFGQSWLVADYSDGVNVSECKNNCHRPSPSDNCDPKKEQLAKYLCGKMEKDFYECFEAMEPNMRDQYRFSCVYDLCHISANTSEGICQFANALLNECQVNMKLSTYSWRGYCPRKCGRNQEFKLRRKVSDSRTCVKVTKKILNAYVDDPHSKSEGCFCRKGFVMQDDECIKEEDCGCTYNGTYYAIGAVVINEGCKKFAKCARNNTLIFETLNCSKDADCGVQDGIYGCYCKDGFVGDGIHCSTDYCSLPNMNCTSDSKCVNAEKGFYCTCLKGYNTYCDRCEDIDECKTGTHKCDRVGNCINTVGSYRCTCPEGYYLDNKKCRDIDECGMNTHNCSAHSRCFNKGGGFGCLCCSGYTKKNGKCVESGEIKPGEQTKCCACHGYICGLKGTVCGTDGVTYNNMSEMVISACEKNTTIKLDYRHKCERSCDLVRCPKYQVCEMDEATGKPVCKCEPCSETDIMKIPVCSQVNVIYESMCQFKQFQCRFNIEQIILDAKQCKPGDGGSAVGPWTPWNPCSVTCGKGTKTRKREALRTLDEFEKNSLPLDASADCYEDPCPDGPCVNHKCQVSSQHCVTVDGRAKCECPKCVGEGKDPACVRIYVGMYAYTEQTFNNPCEGRRTACHKGLDMKPVDDVACGLLPVNCSYVANFVNVTDGECHHDGEVNMGKCVGGCGTDAGHCCDVVAFENASVNLNCPNGTKRKKQVMKINKCQCIEQTQISLQRTAP